MPWQLCQLWGIHVPSNKWHSQLQVSSCSTTSTEKTKSCPYLTQPWQFLRIDFISIPCPDLCLGQLLGYKRCYGSNFGSQGCLMPQWSPFLLPEAFLGHSHCGDCPVCCCLHRKITITLPLASLLPLTRWKEMVWIQTVQRPWSHTVSVI